MPEIQVTIDMTSKFDPGYERMWWGNDLKFLSDYIVVRGNIDNVI